MKGLSFVLPLAFVLAVGGETPWSSDASYCFPDRMEGTLMILEWEHADYIAYDFLKRKLLQQRHFDSDEFEILNLDTGDLYAFNSTGCKRVRTISLTASHRQCWDDQAMAEFRALGPMGELDAAKFTFMDANYNVTQLNGKKDGLCFPIINEAINKLTSERTTRVFVDMREGVSTDKIMSSLDCDDRYPHVAPTTT